MTREDGSHIVIKFGESGWNETVFEIVRLLLLFFFFPDKKKIDIPEFLLANTILKYFVSL